MSEITLTASALNFSAPPSDTLPDKKADAGRGMEEGSIYFLALLICRNLSLTEREGMTASLFPRIISGERSGKNRAHIRRWKIVKFQNECFNLVKLNSAYEVKIPRPPKVKKEEMSILPRPPFVREMRALALRIQNRTECHLRESMLPHSKVVMRVSD